MLATVRALGAQMEALLAGALDKDVRRNMHTEVISSMAYGVFYACIIPFIPVVLRRAGATPEMIALYASLQFLGSLTTSLSLVLMQRRRTFTVIITFWLLARSLFLITALVQGSVPLIALGSLYWLLEGFVIPGYTRVVQKLYPDEVRGKVMSTVRMGQVAAILLVTPLAGWALDHIGYRTLFPVASLVGIASVLIFTRMRLDEGPLPPRQTKALTELVQIVRSDRRFGIYLLSFALLGVGTMLSWPLYPLVQVDRLHLSYSQIGLLGLVESCMWLISYLVWGRYLDGRGGVAVMRAVCAVSMITPLSYMIAWSGWLLIPASLARGIVMGGFELGRINAGIQLSSRERITEYAVIQSTVVGLRGIFGPQISVALLGAGFSDVTIFALSAGVMAVAWLIFGLVNAPTPAQGNEEMQQQAS
ncbi:MAG: MFS transporter [Caldilineaceae bacterium]